MRLESEKRDHVLSGFSGFETKNGIVKVRNLFYFKYRKNIRLEYKARISIPIKEYSSKYMIFL